MLPTRQLSLRNHKDLQHGEPCRLRLAYLVLLRVEIARFTRTESARLCCSDPHLRAHRANSLGWSVERCYLLRCPVQSGRSSSTPFRVLLRGSASDGRDPFKINHKSTLTGLFEGMGAKQPWPRALVPATDSRSSRTPTYLCPLQHPPPLRPDSGLLEGVDQFLAKEIL